MKIIQEKESDQFVIATDNAATELAKIKAEVSIDFRIHMMIMLD